MDNMEIWSYRGGGDEWGSFDLSGFKVEAADGSIGHVDEKSNEVGTDYIVVDTGPWIFGKKVMLPAGVVSTVDLEDKRVFVDRTKSDIKNSPEFDESEYRDPAYRDKLGGYYGGPMA